LLFSSSASGWPMPPAAPRTATLNVGSPAAAVGLRLIDACSLKMKLGLPKGRSRRRA